MRKVYLFSLLVVYSTLLFSQIETTFKTNGPDDYREGLHAFTNATIWKDYQTKLDSATLVIRDGKVVAAGKGITIPKGAIMHDMTGKYIYPSFIDIFSDYGMPEIKKTRGSEDPQMESNIQGAYAWNQAIHTDFEAINNFKSNQPQAEELLKLGFGAVLTQSKDGIARGTGSVVTLANTRENEVVIKAQASAGYSFSKGSSTQDYPSSLMGSIALLRQTYYDADWYKTTTDRKEYNINLEKWNTQQTLPQLFDAGGDWQKLLRADKLGDEFGVQYIIKGSGDEYQRTDEIKKTGAKIITTLKFPKAFDVEDPYKADWVSTEEMKNWELAPTNCAALAKAGIDFALTTADLEKKDMFTEALQKAVKYGLDSTMALKALTYNPANFINVFDKVGSLDAGKVANFFITSKPLFSDKAEINENWVQGKRYIVKPFDQKDIRGTYQLSWCPEGAKCKQIPKELKITGDAATPKATVGIDTAKVDVKLSYKEQDITIMFDTDKKRNEGKVRLTGVIDYANNRFSGKGQLAEGQWVDWQAMRIEGPEADTTKPKKDTIDYTKNLGKVIYPFTAYGNEEVPVQENVLIKNGTVWTNEAEGVLSNADVVIKAGKISAVGKNLSCDDCRTIDATGKYITSGIIDEHSHIAISQGVNEGAKAISSEVRIGDVINSEDINIYRQLAGGVTAAQLLHGSANPIGGQSALIKLRWGYAPEKMKIEGAPGFIKFALGENVKQSNWGDHQTTRYPQTRMGVEQTYYNYFTKAREYGTKWKVYNAQNNTGRKGRMGNAGAAPRRDLELEALDEILNGKRFITCHSYVQSEINMLMHVADTFGFKMNTFTHILEGYKVADKMKAHGVYASTFADWWAYKYEVIDAIPYNAAIMTKEGIITAVNSDDAEMARRLNQEAAKTIKYGGLTEEQAWKLCTLNPATMLHLDSHMGSLKAGKDADVVIWSGNPLSIYAKCEKTFVDGICFYDNEHDALMRGWLQSERARLIQKMLDEKKSGAPTQQPVKKAQHLYTCDDLEP